MKKQPTSLHNPIRCKVCGNQSMLIGAPDTCWACYVAHSSQPQRDAAKSEAVKPAAIPEHHPAIIPGSIPKWS